jgi:SAM-dependent methyltransferase
VTVERKSTFKEDRERLMSRVANVISGSLTESLSDVPEEMSAQAAPGTWEVALRHLPSPCRVLVAGAGRGGLSWLLARHGYQVTSLDLHPDHFVAPGLTCLAADFNEPLPLKSDSQDCVLAVEVAEHLEAPWMFLREALRVLRPGGMLVFTSPNVVSLPARLLFLRAGVLPYFRVESFVGCYHVTPIFPWAVHRWAGSVGARVTKQAYSRANWPDRRDVPRFWERRWMRLLKGCLPVNALTGEITCYVVLRADDSVVTERGVHYR